MKRGGQVECEIAHGKRLIEAGAENVWGWDTPAGRERVTARVRWLTQVCHLREGVRVLECGCGTGVFTEQLAWTGARITAVDISNDLLERARERCRQPNVSFQRCNLEEPDELPDAGFDAMVGISVLHHLDLKRALPALRRTVRLGANVAFSEPNFLNPINKYIFSDDPSRRERLGVSPKEMAFRPRELREAFQSAGFAVTSLSHRDFLHPQVPGLLIPLVKAGQYFVERLPVIRRWSGSLWIHAVKPPVF